MTAGNDGARSRAPDPARASRGRGRRIRLTALALAGSIALATLLTLPVLLEPGQRFRIPLAGDVSERDYESPADVSIVDPEATQALVREAAEGTAAVYDFDLGRARQLEELLAAGFTAARERLPQEEPTEEAGETPVAAFRAALGERDEIPEAAIEQLALTEFADRDRFLTVQLLRSVAPRMIVREAEEFGRRFDKRGVVVRELGSGVDQPLESRAAVLALPEALELLDEAAGRLLAEEPPEQRNALRSLAAGLISPNLDYNLRASEERSRTAEQGVQPVTITLRQGEVIVRRGDRVTPRHVLLLEGIREQQTFSRRLEIPIGVALLLALLFRIVWRFGSSGFRRFRREVRDATFLVSALLASALATLVAVFLCDAVAQTPFFAPLVEQSPGLLYFAIPVAAATMLVRLVHNSETAVLFALVISVTTGFQMQADLGYAAYTLAGSLMAAIGAARVTRRGALLRAGLRVSSANMVAILALHLLGGEIVPLALLVSLGLGLLAGLVSGVVVSGIAPVVESLFSYTTDIRLLELANRENSLLRELEMSAPGTYHHSMMVGHLAEMAAEAIGANALEAKVAGYYHDIGKLRRPQFFIENVPLHHGENRHEKLSPSMSARIIQAHVKDGAEIAESNRLAAPILRGIRQHHGTSVIRFFYEKARRLADPDKGAEVAEHDYRYPGPKPQTREAGILMLADSVEAASRALADNNPARVRQLVQRIINNYFRDGQLDECSLTLRDLHAIARTFSDTLGAIRHGRIDYPEPSEADGREAEPPDDEGVVEWIEPRRAGRSEPPAAERPDALKRLGLP